jgi:hypothetical protein
VEGNADADVVLGTKLAAGIAGDGTGLRWAPAPSASPFAHLTKGPTTAKLKSLAEAAGASFDEATLAHIVKIVTPRKTSVDPDGQATRWHVVGENHPGNGCCRLRGHGGRRWRVRLGLRGCRRVAQLVVRRGGERHHGQDRQGRCNSTVATTEVDGTCRPGLVRIEFNWYWLDHGLFTDDATSRVNAYC